MTFFSLLMFALLLPSAQPAVSDPRIAICVAAPMREGFVDTDKAIHDSIEDLRDNLRKKKGVRLVTDPAAADLILRVKARGIASQRMGAAAIPVGNGAIVAPLYDNQKVVYTVLEVGEFRKDFTAGTAGWGDSAEEIARQVKAWIDGNQSILLDRRRKATDAQR